MELKLCFLGIIFCLAETAVGNEFGIVSTTQSPNEIENLKNLVSKLEGKIENQNVGKYDELASRVAEIQKSLSTFHTKLDQIAKPPTQSRVTLPTSCREIQKRGQNVSNIYLIQPQYAPKSFLVLCDMETKGGGWTHFFNRFDGSENFALDWAAYREGFGDTSREFWLGLEHLHELTGYEANELLVELSDWDGKTVYALYDAFSIGSEVDGYPMKILGTYSGDAGDSLRHHAGMKFTTEDRDQDLRASGNCATFEKGRWWYRDCTTSNLTALYLKANVTASARWQVMYWDTFRGSAYSLKAARMMIRPTSGLLLRAQHR